MTDQAGSSKAQAILEALSAPPAAGPFGRLRRSMATRARRRLLAKNDPLVRYRLDGVDLWMQFSHTLPLIRAAHPDYSKNLARIVRAVDRAHPGSPILDVGANVGDSVAIVRSAAASPVLCIEGNPVYLRVLDMNVPALGRVEVERSFLGTGEVESGFGIATERGTAILVKQEAGEGIRTRRLAEVLQDHPAFVGFRLLKCDTDGFDCRILRAAGDVLASARPVLFFEYDVRLLRALGDDGLSIFPFLAERGYGRILVWDNVGKYLASVDAGDQRLLEDLHSYFSNRGDAYMDLCAVSHEDASIAEAIRAGELSLDAPP